MTRNKKGFTLVELVIVIAVIAILAGVMVAVFSGVVRRANESAELQQVKNDELKQKAEDVLTKLDNANWFSWEDFENSLAAKLEKTYEKYANTSSGVTTEQLEKVVKKALEEYGASAGQDNTALTEAQVKAIVENALANAKLGGVTENQVRTIVNTAVADINTVSKSDIQKIVDAATAKGLTAAQVAQVVADAKLASATSVSDLNTKVGKIITDLATVSENALTKEDVEAMIKKLLPVTVTVKATETQTLQEAFNEAVTTLVSGSTIIVESETAPELTLTTDDVTTLTIKGVDVDKLTVNAPNATIYVLSDVGTVEVTAVAQNSLHLRGDVKLLKVTKGRIVLEQGVKVENVEINSEGLGDKVVVVVEKDAAVTELLNVLDAQGSILVENKGVINQVLAEEEVPAGKSQVVNVDGGVVTKLAESDDGNDTGLVVISGDNTPKRWAVVTNEEELTAALAAVKNKAAYADVEAGKLNTIILGNDITVANPIMVSASVTIDGDGYTITSSANRGFRVDTSKVNVTICNVTIVGGSNFERAIQLDSNKTDVTLNITKVNATATYYTVNLCVGTTCYLTVEDSVISGWGALNMWSDGYILSVKNSELYGINKQKAGSNDFATIVLEGDTTCLTDMHSSNNEVNIENTKIVAEAKSTAKQSLIGFNTGCENNVVTLTDCTIVLDDSGLTSLYYDLGLNNSIIIDEDPANTPIQPVNMVWYSNAAFNTTRTGGMKTTFATPFVNGWMASGEGIILNQDITLDGNVTCAVTSGSIYIYFDGHTITGGKIVLSGASVISDVGTMASVFEGTVNVVDNGNGTYTYSLATE